MDAKTIISNARAMLSEMDISSSDIRMEEFEKKDSKYHITISYLTPEKIPTAVEMPISETGRLVRSYKDLIVNPNDNSVQSIKIHRN